MPTPPNTPSSARLQRDCIAKNNNLHLHPIELSDTTLIEQKLDYIHHNPLEAGIVENPEECLYSSARNYIGKKGSLDVVFLN